MTTTPVGLQDLRRKIYVKAKAEPHWRFWGLYVHVCKMETLHAAYAMAEANDGSPGSDGVTFEVIEEQGVEAFLEQILDVLPPLVRGLRSEVLPGHFLQGKKAVALRAVFDECRFETRLYAGNPAFIDVGFFLFPGWDLN